MTAARAAPLWRSLDVVVLVALLALAVLNYLRGSYGAVVVTSIGAALLATFVLLTRD